MHHSKECPLKSQFASTAPSTEVVGEGLRLLAVARGLCPLSPTIDATFGSDSTVGERAGVRG